MRRLVCLTLFAATAAHAADLVAIKPGLMCANADALACLTLPGGDSRTHRPNANPADHAAAAAGGCIDIPDGARVSVHEAFRNTSRVFYAGPGAPADGMMTVPNVDFRTADTTAAIATSTASGLTPAARVPASDGLTVVLMLDRRITPAVRQALEAVGGDPSEAFEPQSALYAEFKRRPLLNAAFVLEGPGGAVIERKQADRPLATVAPANIAGLPHPALLLTVDYRTGVGSWPGPQTTIVVPAETKLAPVQAMTATGGTEPLAFVQSLHALWRIVPARSGGSGEILSVSCKDAFTNRARLNFQVFHFVGGRWTVSSRLGGECDQMEAFPSRREFP